MGWIKFIKYGKFLKRGIRIKFELLDKCIRCLLVFKFYVFIILVDEIVFFRREVIINCV